MRGTAAGRAAVSLLLVPAACSSEPGHRAAQVDIANAAETPLVRPDPAAPPRAIRGRGPDNAVMASPPAADDAQEAASVIRAYFASIAGGRFIEAWALWDDDGAASGMSADAFAASFAKYSDYRAEIGAPGRVDAGAGQRYVTVPVEVRGRLRDGSAFAMEGPVTLHRTADIDGATADQRSWRISASGLKPRPE